MELNEVMDMTNQRNIWIFQANPERFDILNSLADPDIKLRMWTVNRQFKNKIHSMDMALIWMSGKDAGIYAIAKVISEPQIMEDTLEESKYWLKIADKKIDQLRVCIRIIKDMHTNPILRSDLKNTPGLEKLSILGKFPSGANFYVRPHEWEIIKNLIKKKI